MEKPLAVINTKRHNIGDVVYYVHRTKEEFEWRVSWGIVSDIFSDVYQIKRYTRKDMRYINGIKFKDFPFGEKEYKLPKGYKYDENLFELEYKPLEESEKKLCKISIKDKKGILNIIEKGIFVPYEEYDFANVEADYCNNGKYKIVRKYDNSKDSRPYLSIGHPFVFDDYNDALKCVEEHDKEMERVANLSDLEFSKEEIEKDLQKYKKINCLDNDIIVDKYREFLFSLKNLEDVETRLRLNDIQWKYTNKKKWNNIDVF